jgi:cell division protein ZipA
MDLRYALLLIGVLIIGGVALSAYDKFRFDWGRRPSLGALGLRRRGVRGDVAEPEASPLPSPPESRSSGLDLNPPPPSGDTGQKFLRPDAQVGPETERSSDYYLYQELESLENVAHMPLNLSLGLVDPVVQMETHALVRRHMPEEKIDFVITLPGKGPIKRDQALGIYKQNEYLLEKPRFIYGLGYKTGLWSSLSTDAEYAQYSDIALALQMVDSRGAVSESELNTFVQLSLKLADELQRPTKLSITIEEALERARALDAFCSANDVLASVNIVANGKSGFTGRAINQAATRLGMQFGKMNIYHMKNDNQLGCRHLFSLANLYAPGEFNPETMNTLKTQGLTLFMSVPCAYQPVQVFERMIATAKGLCEMLDGKMQDHEKQVLTDQGLTVIRTQIERIAADMQSSGIIPGSETAMRLF